MKIKWYNKKNTDLEVKDVKKYTDKNSADFYDTWDVYVGSTWSFIWVWTSRG